MEHLNWHDQDGSSEWDETIGSWPTAPATQLLDEPKFGPTYLEPILAALDRAGLDIKAWLADQGITECITQSVLCQAVLRVVLRQSAASETLEDSDIESLAADMLQAAIQTVTENWDHSLHSEESDLIDDDDLQDSLCTLWAVLTAKNTPGSRR